jgi:hypothetical protein
VKPGERFSLGFDLKSVAGLEQVQLIGAGTALELKSFPGAPREAHVDFPLSTQRSTWYSLVVEDRQGRKAYTDPIWVSAVTAPH